MVRIIVQMETVQRIMELKLNVDKSQLLNQEERLKNVGEFILMAYKQNNV